MTYVSKAAALLIKNPDISDGELSEKIRGHKQAAWTFRKSVNDYMERNNIKIPKGSAPRKASHPDLVAKAEALGANIEVSDDHVVIRIPRQALSKMLLSSLLESPGHKVH